MIDTDNLTRTFKNITAVEELSLHIEEGEVFGLLGPNGAGKTTTVRMLCCLISPSSGMATINGLNITNKTDQPKIRGIIGLLPENIGLNDALSVFANLDFFGRFYKVPAEIRSERIESLLKMLGLWEKRDIPAGSFSKGMKQKLAIARALIHDPKVLFLDEPTANLDPEATKMVRDTLLELKKEGRTIFINTHMLDEAEKICDRIGILKTKLLTIGSPEKIRKSLTGQKTMVQLEYVSDAIITAIKYLGKNVEVDGNKLIVSVNNPEVENPKIIDSILANGGRIQLMNDISPTLEDVYSKTVKED